jgi:hypothetical protein
MSTITFKALIDGVHFDPKKGVVKIQLIAGSHVSMDKLVRLGPSDENITVILQSPQTEIDAFPLDPNDAKDALTFQPETETDEEKLEREAREYEREREDAKEMQKMPEDGEEKDKIITEFD